MLLLRKILYASGFLSLFFNMTQLLGAPYSITVHNKTNETIRIFMNAISPGKLIDLLGGDILVLPSGDAFTQSGEINYALEIISEKLLGDPIPIYTKTLGEEKKHLYIMQKDLKKWIDAKKVKPIHMRQEIDIYLRKRKKNPSVIEALTPAELAKIEFRAKQALKPKAKLEAVLDIKPGTIRKQIFDLAKENKYTEMEKLLGTINDLKELKQLINFQYDIALILANQIDFEASESHAFLRFPQQTIIKIDPEELTERRKIQWLYVILTSKEELQEFNSLLGLNDPLTLLHDFLVDLGYLPEEFTRISNIQEAQKTIARNFKELFERFFMVMKIEPWLLPQLEIVKKAMKIQ